MVRKSRIHSEMNFGTIGWDRSYLVSDSFLSNVVAYYYNGEFYESLVHRRIKAYHSDRNLYIQTTIYQRIYFTVHNFLAS